MAGPGVVGVYEVKVPQGEGKVGTFGKLTLEGNSTFKMNVGKVDMSGTWSQQGDMIVFTSADENAKMLSAQKYKIDGKKLVPVGDLGIQNHWWLQKE